MQNDGKHSLLTTVTDLQMSLSTVFNIFCWSIKLGIYCWQRAFLCISKDKALSFSFFWKILVTSIVSSEELMFCQVHARCYGELEPVNGVLWLCNLCRPGAPEPPPPCCLCPVVGKLMLEWLFLCNGMNYAFMNLFLIFL